MSQEKNFGVLTSGGDAPGMNAAVRAVVRTALAEGFEVQAIREGFEGLVGAGKIEPVGWNDVGGILHRGGTAIGSARCERFRNREGRLEAARNLVHRAIGMLVVIGGDGTLQGILELHAEWPELLAELVGHGKIDPVYAGSPPPQVVALAGSIDNDLFGTDMTLGADTALHRIVEAVDALSSTAASHQRTFVVEVMGRHCGYLALMAALATGADFFLVPEDPPPLHDWERQMCDQLQAGHDAGRRDLIVILAEGALDRRGHRIEADFLRQSIETNLGFETRVAVLGHVQRGGSPSAFDRYFGSRLGFEAVRQLAAGLGAPEPVSIGLLHNQIFTVPAREVLEQTRRVAAATAAGRFKDAVGLRGGGFGSALDLARRLTGTPPRAGVGAGGVRPRRLAVLHAGALAPGMNAAVQAAARLAFEAGFEVVGIPNGFRGLRRGEPHRVLSWRELDGWGGLGGAELGTSAESPRDAGELAEIAQRLADLKVDALLMIGGWAGYAAIKAMIAARGSFPAFRIPMIAIPAAIENNLPGCQVSLGADTALNNLVEAIDKIKQAAEAEHRCVVVEVLGGYCGYLALMAALTTGAELLYLHEDGIRLADLESGLKRLKRGFAGGKRLGLVIRSEKASPYLTTDFLCSFFEAEGQREFQVRRAVLGDLQRGGDPTPFDRVLAVRSSAVAIEFLAAACGNSPPPAWMLGLADGRIQHLDFKTFGDLVERELERAKDPWWSQLREMADLLAGPPTGAP